jgi:hypothetical protein
MADEGLLPPIVDPELAALVEAVDDAGDGDHPAIALPITVLVGGTVVSGFLISVHEWRAHLITDLRASLLREPDPQGFERADAFRDRLVAVIERHDKADPDGRLAGVRCLHLRMAHTFEAAGVVPSVPNEHLALRIRLDLVQGWSFGTIVRTGPPSAIVTLLDSGSGDPQPPS